MQAANAAETYPVRGPADMSNLNQFGGVKTSSRGKSMNVFMPRSQNPATRSKRRDQQIYLENFVENVVPSRQNDHKIMQSKGLSLMSKTTQGAISKKSVFKDP